MARYEQCSVCSGWALPFRFFEGDDEKSAFAAYQAMVGRLEEFGSCGGGTNSKTLFRCSECGAYFIDDAYGWERTPGGSLDQEYFFLRLAEHDAALIDVLRANTSPGIPEDIRHAFARGNPVAPIEFTWAAACLASQERGRGANAPLFEAVLTLAKAHPNGGVREWAEAGLAALAKLKRHH